MAKKRHAHLPRDFDARYFNAAPEDQQIQGDLTGDEVVEVQNVGPHGALTFELPKVDIVVSVCLGEDLIERPMRCDTVIVNADHATLSMVWRASFDVHQQVAKLHWCSLEQSGGQ
ncbi:MAG: DUF2169 domain-containing protein [Pirellulaceae bacterium]|nr:DUF2169 domain-containing protein [Pirellulaceae bacterium]